MDQHQVLPQLRDGIHFLPKPYNMSELLDAIRLCFRHADVGVLTGPDAQAPEAFIHAWRASTMAL